MKPLESLCNPFGEVRDWGRCKLDALHDQVRPPRVIGEEMINLGNVWCARVAGCKLGDVLLRLVLGEQRLVVAEFNEEAFEDYKATKVA